jgi:uncharacterized membrane protein (DUF441 family)
MVPGVMASVVIGCVVARLCLYGVKHAFREMRQLQAVIFCTVYGVWLVCEVCAPSVTAGTLAC